MIFFRAFLFPKDVYMRMKINSNAKRHFLILLLSVLLFAIGVVEVRAQKVARKHAANRFEVATVSAKTSEPVPEVKPETTDAKINTLEQMLVEQSQRLDRLQQTMAEQQETIRLLTAKLNSGEVPATSTAQASVAPQTVKSPTVDDRLKTVESRISELSAIKFSGDIRLRSESFFGQSNSLANGANSAGCACARACKCVARLDRSLIGGCASRPAALPKASLPTKP